MALTTANVTFDQDQPLHLGADSGVRIMTGTFTGEASYTDGGPSANPVFPTGRVLGIEFYHAAGSTQRYEYDRQNQTIVAYVRSTGLQVAAAVDLSALTARFLVHFIDR